MGPKPHLEAKPQGLKVSRGHAVLRYLAMVKDANENASVGVTPHGGELRPMWSPGRNELESCNLAVCMKELSFSDYQSFHRWSVENAEAFWAWALESLGIHFAQRPSSILSGKAENELPTWLPNAKLNIAESCFQAPPDRIAIVCGAGDGRTVRTSYQELRAEANRVANGLRDSGIRPGDAVALFMPMTARAVAVYLGSILAGCAVVCIADSLPREQVARRLQIGGARLVFTVSAIRRGATTLPMYDRVSESGLPTVLVDDEAEEQRPIEERAITWKSFAGDSSFNEVERVNPENPTSILFSSGTTGEPKAIVWDHVTPLRCAVDGFFHQDVHDGDVVAWPTNYGWMMGAWLTFATLINKGTMALFDGVPTTKAFGKFVEDCHVTILGVVPTLVARWRASQCMEGLNWTAIRLFSSTGECSNASDMRYLSSLAGGKPVIEYCGGTELGGGYLSSTLLQDNIPSTFSTPTLGSDFIIVDELGRRAQQGEAFLRHPALGMSRKLLNADHRAIYYDNVPTLADAPPMRRHGDRVELLANGYYRALGRTDDTFNIGGIKTSSIELENAIASHCDLSEFAVIGVDDPLGGPARLVVCIKRNGSREIGSLQTELQRIIRAYVCPLFKIADILECDQLPRTSSNKLNRRAMKVLYENRQA
jgi:acetyl-CoA synthetase